MCILYTYIYTYIYIYIYTYIQHDDLGFEHGKPPNNPMVYPLIFHACPNYSMDVLVGGIPHDPKIEDVLLGLAGQSNCEDHCGGSSHLVSE